MKKLLLSILCSGFLFISIGYGAVSEAAELEKGAEFYYVIDDTPTFQSRTWVKTQNYTINVTYKRYRKVDTKTVTSTTSYTDYVRV